MLSQRVRHFTDQRLAPTLFVVRRACEWLRISSRRLDVPQGTVSNPSNDSTPTRAPVRERVGKQGLKGALVSEIRTGRLGASSATKPPMRPRSAYVIAASTWVISEFLRWSCAGSTPSTDILLSASSWVFLAWGLCLTCLDLVDHMAKRSAEVAVTLAATWLIFASQLREVRSRLDDPADPGEKQCTCGSRKKFRNCHGKLRRGR